MRSNIIKITSLALLLMMSATTLLAQQYKSYKGLVMCGYQGWFNTPTDGMNKGWAHYTRIGKFQPEYASIDFWPDMNEYKVKYKTSFQHSDGSAATVFSSADPSTTDLHFSWMKEYGIDGVFLQRFAPAIKNKKGLIHCNQILDNVLSSSKKHNRAVALMYDLSGMEAGGDERMINDIETIESKYKLSKGKIDNYLHHNGKPLITVWGVGFNDGRAYGFDEVERFVAHLKKMGFSVMLGVPTYWRELKSDTVPDERLHEIIKSADIIMPWFVGRYDDQRYPRFKKNIAADQQWCDKEGVDYVPLVFPGFSWVNMKHEDRNDTPISRLGGDFFWRQIAGAISSGAKMLYVAMFDEVDEGTAIMKCYRNSEVPLNGADKFYGIDDHLESDHYLWLTGEAKRALNGEIELTETQPIRN